MNYLSLGPVKIRVSRQGLASWGFPRVAIGGLDLFARDSGGGLTLASYHPARSATWHWSVGLARRTPEMRWPHRFGLALISKRRFGQWHDHYRLPFGWQLRVSRQSYHKEPRNA